VDVPDSTGFVNDRDRIEFLRGHFRAAHQAIEEGVPLKGYYAWSLMDNFEWTRGYAKRFGIVYVDYETQERTPKASALWYRDLIARNALED
jgi:beta-glucosidase